MRWMPKPSVRTLLGVAAVAAGVVLYRRSHDDGTSASKRSAGNGYGRRSGIFGDAVTSPMRMSRR
jgi:hypothetical protein